MQVGFGLLANPGDVTVRIGDTLSLMEGVVEKNVAEDDTFLVSDELWEVTSHKFFDLSDELIFHYCSAQTLITLLKKKTLRFTDATCLNDGEEILWAEIQLKEAIRRLRDRDEIEDHVPAISKRFLDMLLEEWRISSNAARHFLACFSLSGDSLSQWRAYADDAQGFSVGFCIKDIDVPAAFLGVEYNQEVQQTEIINALSAMFELFKNDKKYFDHQGMMDVMHLLKISSSYKNPAFVDEREVRAVHMVGVQPGNDGGRSLDFIGGTVGSKNVDKGEIEFRVSKGRLTPYIDFGFQLESECAIKEIWLGPRCNTPKADLEMFLRTMGFANVSVKEAGSRYR